MKNILIILFLGLLLSTSGVLAEDNSVAPAITTLPTLLKYEDVAKPDRPLRPAQSQRAALMKEVLNQFKQKRSEYLAQQKTLARQLKGSSEEDRQLIRERMKEVHAAFAEAKEEFKAELRTTSEQLREQSRKLRGEVSSSSKRE